MVLKINFKMSEKSLMEPIDLKILYRNEWGEMKTDIHSMDIKSAKRLQNELSDSINKALSLKAQKNREKKKIIKLSDLLEVRFDIKTEKSEKPKKHDKKKIYRM